MPVSRGRGPERIREIQDSGEADRIIEQAEKLKNYEQWEKGPKKQYVRVSCDLIP